MSLADARASWIGRAKVAESDGQVSFEPWHGELELPDWLAEGARVLLRAAWQKRRAGETWPRRLARWRPEPDAKNE